jgi:hypothetical protein
MVYFHTKNPDLGKFCRAMQWKMLVFYMTIWSILWLFIYIPSLWPFGLFYDYLVNFFRFGMSYQEESGNPDEKTLLRNFC